MLLCKWISYTIGILLYIFYYYINYFIYESLLILINSLLLLKIFFYYLYNILLKVNGFIILNINYKESNGLLNKLPFNN